MRPYNVTVHRAAIAAAQAALTLDNYDARRKALQAAVKPLIDEQFTLEECKSMWKDSTWASSISMDPNPSNFTQRLNAKTCTWIIATHGPDVPWRERLANAFMTSFDARSVGNPEVTNTENKEHLLMIETGTTAAAELPGIPDVPGIIDIADTMITDHGMSEADTFSALAGAYPSDAATIEAAKTLRALRGERTDPLPTLAGDQELIRKIIMGEIELGEPTKEAPAAPKYTPPDEASAKLIDNVLKGYGLPTIRDLVDTANVSVEIQAKIAAMQTEVDEYKRKLASRPAIAEVTVTATGAIPGGKVVLKNAADLMGVTDPKRRKLLDFDVPVGEWVDASGNEVPHPHVPALDEDFIFAPHTLVPMLLSIVSNDKPWLKGHTGTGKTTLVEQVYARLNLPLYRVNLDSDISRSELVGRDSIKRDAEGHTATQFVEGIIPRVMQEPCGLLLDEIDASRPDLAFVLQRLMEGKGFMLLEDGGRTIVPHPWFRIFATANTNGRGDDTGLYTGTRVLGAAFVNRFKPFLNVDYIDPKSEFKLVQQKAPTLDKGIAEQIVSYAKEARVAFTQGTVGLPCSPRDTVAMAQQMVAYLGIFPTREEALKLAFEHIVLNAADNDDAVILKGIADRVFKIK